MIEGTFQFVVRIVSLTFARGGVGVVIYWNGTVVVKYCPLLKLPVRPIYPTPSFPCAECSPLRRSKR